MRARARGFQVPLLRKIARQKYLEDREEKKLRELQDAIDDEE